MLLINLDRQFFSYCCNQRRLIELLSSISDADAFAVAADRSTAVVAAAGVKRIKLSGMLLHATDPELNNPDHRLLFRCCCCCNQRLLIELLSFIADAPAVATDRSTAVVAVVADAADPEL